jgi:methylphosphotriester-DNA--protein-cysteine methyltransferase
LLQYKVKKALKTLSENVDSIPNVQSWANESSLSVSKLAVLTKRFYKKTPGEILREARYEKIVQSIEQDPLTGAYCVALDSGFSSEAALRMFLRRRFDTNFRSLRKDILSGIVGIEYNWIATSD